MSRTVPVRLNKTELLALAQAAAQAAAGEMTADCGWNVRTCKALDTAHRKINAGERAIKAAEAKAGK